MSWVLGLIAAHHLIHDGGNSFTNTNSVAGAIKPSRWQILNVSAGGYALRKFNSSQASARIGDVVAMKNSKSALWELAVLRWAHMNELNQLDVGLELISPNAIATTAKFENNAIEGEALLLPELAGLKQAASLITARGFCKIGDILKLNTDDKPRKIVIQKISRTHCKI